MVWRLSDFDTTELRLELALPPEDARPPPIIMETNGTFGGNVSSASNCSAVSPISYPRSCSAPADNQCPLPGQSPASPVAMFTVGVLGNIIALIVLFLSRKNHKRTVFYLLVTGLAWTDLLGKIFTTPMVWAVYINNMKWLGGCYTCNYHGWSMVAAGLSSCLIVFVMAVERFIAIRQAYFYNAHVTRTKAKIALVMCWMVAVLFAALPLMGLGENVMHFPGTWCFFNFYGKETASTVYASLFVAVLGVCILGTLFCNLSVIATLLRMRNAILRTSSMSQSEDFHQNVHLREEDSPRRRRRTNVRAETQMVVLLAGVSIIFTVSWSPLMIRVLLNQLPDYESDIQWDLISVRMASMNQILDPWIYILFRRELFHRVITIVKDLTCKIRQVPKQPPGANKRESGGMVTFSNGHAGRVATRAVADAIFHDAIDETETMNPRENVGERRPSKRVPSLNKRRPSWRDCIPALSPNNHAHDDRFIYSSMEDVVFEEPTTKFETMLETPETSPMTQRQKRTLSDGAVSNFSPNTLKRRASGSMEKSHTFHGTTDQ